MDNNKFLICVDSDGCVIDSMTIKHKLCFGPCLVSEWGLESVAERVKEIWNNVNLYSKNRGVNRFKGLYLVLSIINEKIKPINGLNLFKKWCDSTHYLSNRVLEKKTVVMKSFIKHLIGLLLRM